MKTPGWFQKLFCLFDSSDDSDDVEIQQHEHIQQKLEKAQEENKALRSALTQNWTVNVDVLDTKIKEVIQQQSSIASFVDTLIKDEHINIAGLPDFIERKIYTNIFELLLNVLRDTLTNVHVDVLGRRITVKMEQV